jgi:Flp pilus assembly protein TadD
MQILRRIALLVGILFSTLAASAEVRVWQGTLTLPTYEEGPPDPNPPFDQFTTDRFNYPYTLRNNLTGRRSEHAWRAVYLENEYLKCSVLPDIGGHLYTCVDKISGIPMFYANPSIKKAAIAYRGAWAAFGVEFNFPVSHNWVSMSPVNFAFGKQDDGSASVTVGNIDRVYGMEWTVELILRPKSTVLEQRVTLNNRSDVRHRFYWWNNAGVEVWDDSRIEYPMRFVATHGFTEVHPWPVDTDGVDYSLVSNQKKGPVSMFAHGSREPFMGIWNPHTNTGTVHFADYDELPAKKIWSWGVDADGLDWRKALSDNNSAYMEVQGGLFRNQETYAFLEPRQVIHFAEYWMSVRDIGAISRANLAGVAALIRKGNSLLAGFNANELVPQASVSLSKNGQAIFREKVDLKPEQTWTHEIANADPQAKYTIEVQDAKGAVLLRHTEGEYDWTPESEIQVGPQPVHQIPEAEKRSYDDWIEFAKNEELNGRNLSALDAYQKTLSKFPDSFVAQRAAGRLAAALLRYEDAKRFLEPLRARDTTDTELAYYLGLAYDGLGDREHARSAYEGAERLPSFYAAAALRLGELLAQSGDQKGAVRHLSGAFQAAPDDLRIREELVAIQTAAGHPQQARTLAEETLSRFRLSNFLREELGSPDLMQLANDPNRILGVASEYMRLGLYRKALNVLARPYPAPAADQSEPGSLAPDKHPMIAYFRGYCREKLGESAAADFKTASTLSTAYIFPNTEEEFAVLRAALQARPTDGAAHYLLGTFYFARGMTDPALNEWTLARRFAPDLAVVSASTGLALLHIKNDPEAAVSAFRQGLQSDPANIANYLGLDQALSLMNRPARERVEALEKYPKLDAAPPSLVFELILNLAEAGDFERANALFHDRFFPREEGGTNVRQIWVEVQLQRVLALANAGHCDQALNTAQHLGAEVPGLAFTRDGLEPILQSARTNYLLGSAYSTCGKPAEAKSKFEVAAVSSAPDQLRWAWLAAQKLPNYNPGEWRPHLKTTYEQVVNHSESSPELYIAGALAKALGKTGEAEILFRKALLLPDRMLAYHFTRLARAEPDQ